GQASGGSGNADPAASGLSRTATSISAMRRRCQHGAYPIEWRPLQCSAPGKPEGMRWSDALKQHKSRFFLRKVLTGWRQVKKMAPLLRRGSRAVKGIRL